VSERRFEELVRREVDGELSRAEHAELDRLCDGVPARVAERRDTARTVAAARTLRARGPAPAGDFSGQVMSRLGPPPRRPGLFGWLFAPRELRLRPVTALAGAAALALVAVLGFHRGFHQPLRSATLPAPAAPAVAAASPPAETTCPAGTVLVRFVFRGERAHRVALAGDFNDWRTDDIVLGDPQGDGVYTTTVPLKAGASYSYMFVVDGERWIEDPLAAAQRPDGFGRRNSLLRL
jgi:hypothetical protein